MTCPLLNRALLGIILPTMTTPFAALGSPMEKQAFLQGAWDSINKNVLSPLGEGLGRAGRGIGNALGGFGNLMWNGATMVPRAIGGALQGGIARAGGEGGGLGSFLHGAVDGGWNTLAGIGRQNYGAMSRMGGGAWDALSGGASALKGTALAANPFAMAGYGLQGGIGGAVNSAIDSRMKSYFPQGMPQPGAAPQPSPQYQPQPAGTVNPQMGSPSMFGSTGATPQGQPVGQQANRGISPYGGQPYPQPGGLYDQYAPPAPYGFGKSANNLAPVRRMLAPALSGAKNMVSRVPKPVARIPKPKRGPIVDAELVGEGFGARLKGLFGAGADKAKGLAKDRRVQVGLGGAGLLGANRIGYSSGVGEGTSLGYDAGSEAGLQAGLSATQDPGVLGRILDVFRGQGGGADPAMLRHALQAGKGDILSSILKGAA